MVVGLNGVGKTTTIGKLAHRFLGEGRKVLLCAADTFRAAAIEQLEVWAQRAGVVMIRQKTGADPSAVVFDALQAAKARGVEYVSVDTAGRLHTSEGLMTELTKITRVIAKRLLGAPHEMLLVLDGTIGQNAVAQARDLQQQKMGPLAGGLGLVAGAASGGESVGIRPVLEIAVALAALGLSCYSLTLLIAQLTSARIATATAGAALLILFLVNRLSMTFTWLASWRWLSPFHYYELNHPLAPGGTFDVWATLTMSGIAVLTAAAAIVLFDSRDLGSPFLRWPARPGPVSYEPSRSLSWRVAVGLSLIHL